MKKLVLVVIVLMSMTSCNKLTRFGDSEISAIRDQNEILKAHNDLVKEQNQILIRIEAKLK